MYRSRPRRARSAPLTPCAGLIALLVALGPGLASAQSIEATRVNMRPEIDGVLDDLMWQQVPQMDDFTQRWPVEGAEPTERSWVKIAYDDNFLYFGFMFYDREPELIRARNMERGGRNDRDDHAYIGLDTFLDGRNAYLFEMNALGTQDDAIIENETLNIDSYSWDALFYSETTIHGEGWTLEVAIPFRQLRFPEGDELEFGLFMRRTINRRNERLNWPLVPLTYGPGYMDDLRAVSRYGRLTGLRNIRRGRNIEVKPYVIAGGQQAPPAEGAPPATDLDGDVGLDVKYGITSNLTLDLTVNTDFAQVEADNAQLNLTRFSLFFPEKREFFLERSGIFEHGMPRRTQTFFSRSIGLDERILAGARLTGQIGGVQLGLLNLQTGNDLRQPFGNGATTNTVARVQHSLFRRGTFGAIVTQRTQAGEWNRALGVDFTHRFGGFSSFSGWFTDVNDSDPANRDRAGFLGLTLRNDLYGASLSYQSVGTDFRPALGFVRRRDLRESQAGLVWSPFLDRGPVRQVTLSVDGTHAAGQDGRLQSSELVSAVKFAFDQRDEIEVRASREFDRLTAPFNLRPDAQLPVDDYRFDRVGLRFVSDPSRPFSASAGMGAGQFYSGSRTDVSLGFGFRQSKHLTLGGSVDLYRVNLPIANGVFDASLVSLDILASLSRDLFAKALIQYDSFSRDLNANIRINWIHTPGSDLFLVFNTSWRRANPLDPFDPRSGFDLNQQVGVIKLTYLFLL